MCLSQQGPPDSVPMPPCWASLPTPGLPGVPCQPMYPHADTAWPPVCGQEPARFSLPAPQPTLDGACSRRSAEKQPQGRPRVTLTSFRLPVRSLPSFVSLSQVLWAQHESTGLFPPLPALCYSERGEEAGNWPQSSGLAVEPTPVKRVSRWSWVRNKVRRSHSRSSQVLTLSQRV